MLSSAARAALVFDVGSTSALSRVDTSALISGLWITSPNRFKDALAACRTWALQCKRHRVVSHKLDEDSEHGRAGYHELGVGEDGGQLWDDGRERERELSRRTEGHRSEKLDRSLLGSPLLLLESLEQRREHNVDAVTRESGHDDLGRILGRVSNVRSRISEGREKQRENARACSEKDGQFTGL